MKICSGPNSKNGVPIWALWWGDGWPVYGPPLSLMRRQEEMPFRSNASDAVRHAPVARGLEQGKFNRFLAALPPHDFSLLVPHLRTITLERGRDAARRGGRDRARLHTCMVSLVAVLGARWTFGRAIVQLPGAAVCSIDDSARPIFELEYCRSLELNRAVSHRLHGCRGPGAGGSRNTTTSFAANAGSTRGLSLRGCHPPPKSSHDLERHFGLNYPFGGIDPL
jgi:hypothetical protein